MRARNPHHTARRLLPWVCLAFLLAGCATTSPVAPSSRPFDFERDTLSYANELVWEYHFDERGEWVTQPREPRPDYTHHCFVAARSARQFFYNARFNPAAPRADAETYRRLVRKVVSSSPRSALPADEKIVIPGYDGLREFSRDHEALLKAECGGAWQSYFQRGHWRMLWPLSRRHQQRTARQLAEDIRNGRVPVVHLVRFPRLTINHAVVLFDVAETEREMVFGIYDPNAPDRPRTLTFDRKRRTFTFPVNSYFPGGRVDVYEIYNGFLY